MSIIFHEKSGEFHLTNGKISYIMEIMENGQMGQLYYGKAIRDRESFSHLHEEMPRSLMAGAVESNDVLSMQYMSQEYPSYGTSDYRMPAFTILQKNGSRISNFTYRSHEIYQGKKVLNRFHPPMWKIRTRQRIWKFFCLMT